MKQMTHDDSGPHRLVGVASVVQDHHGRVLLVLPVDGAELWQLPGGALRAGESVSEGAARTLREGTGLVRYITSVVAFDQTLATDTSVESVHLVCDAGLLSAEEAIAVRVPEDAAEQLAGCAWVHPSLMDEYSKDDQALRIEEALEAIGRGNEVPLLVRGELAAG